MSGKILKLFFPQWQGAGDAKELYHGAAAICKGCFSEEEFCKVEVALEEDLRLHKDIIGYEPILSQLECAAERISVNSPAKIFMIGGDCGTELAPVSFLNKIYKGDLAVIWLDAHGDLNTPSSSASKKFHGMPLRFLLGEGEEEIIAKCFSKLDASQVFLAGARDFDEEECHFIRTNDMSCLSVEDIGDRAENLINSIRSKGFHQVYLHLDLDVLDPDCFPGVLCPSPEGLSLEALDGILEGLMENFNTVGFGVLEHAAPQVGEDGKLMAVLNRVRDRL